MGFDNYHIILLFIFFISCATIDLFYDTGTILMYGMLREISIWPGKKYKNFIFKAIKSWAIHKIHNMYSVRAIQHKISI
jgi:hypothetical protein